MKKFTMLLFGAIFVVLITSYSQPISADHLKDDDSPLGTLKFNSPIFHEMDEAMDRLNWEQRHVIGSFWDTEAKYQIHLQTVFRNGDGHLIHVNESTSSAFIPSEVTDEVFDAVLGEKEIVTVDSVKYEKAQFSFTPSLPQRYISIYPLVSDWRIQIEFSEESVTKMHERDKQYTNWKLHYCADFGEEHGQQCVAMFYVLVPSITLKPTDTVTQQWTILRELN